MPFKRETSLDIFPVLHTVNPQKFLWAKLLSGQLLDLNEFLRIPTSQPWNVSHRPLEYELYDNVGEKAKKHATSAPEIMLFLDTDTQISKHPALAVKITCLNGV